MAKRCAGLQGSVADRGKVAQVITFGAVGKGTQIFAPVAHRYRYPANPTGFGQGYAFPFGEDFPVGQLIALDPPGIFDQPGNPLGVGIGYRRYKVNIFRKAGS